MTFMPTSGPFSATCRACCRLLTPLPAITASPIFLIPPKVDEQIVAILYQALYEGKRLRARYLAKGRTEPREYEVSPQGMIITDNIPYLIATLNEHTDLTQLLFPRFILVELLDKTVTPLPDFSLEQYLQEQSFSYPVSPEPIRLKIRLPVSFASG